MNSGRHQRGGARHVCALLWLAVASAAPAACADVDRAAGAEPCVCPGGAACIDGECGLPALDPEPGTGLHARIIALPDGTTAAATRDLGREAIVVAFFDDAGQLLARHHLRSPGAEPGAGAFPALAFHDGAIHVAWHAPGAGTLLYAVGTRSDGFGEPRRVDGGQGDVAGTHASMAIAPDGVVHLAYRAETARTLRHAELAPGGAWRVRELQRCPEDAPCTDDDADPGHFASIALVPDPGGSVGPRIAHHDAARGAVLLATRGGGEWRVTTLDGGPGSRRVGRFARIAATPNRNLVATFQDDDAGGVRMILPGSPSRLLDDGRTAREDGTVEARRVGEFAALHVDSSGVRHLVHLDATRLEWRYLRVEGDTITANRALEGLAPGVWADITSDALGVVGVYAAFLPGTRLETELRWFRP